MPPTQDSALLEVDEHSPFWFERPARPPGVDVPAGRPVRTRPVPPTLVTPVIPAPAPAAPITPPADAGPISVARAAQRQSPDDAALAPGSTWSAGDTAEFTRRYSEAWSRELDGRRSRRQRRRRRRRAVRLPLRATAVVLLMLLSAGGAWFLAQRSSRSSVHADVVANHAAVVPHRPASAYARRTIPRRWLRMYWQAGAEYGLDWTVLAAIGTIESDNGPSNLPGVSRGTNRAGAAGPAQSETSTWARYSVDTNLSGRPSPYNAADAITTMAAYLKASGAPQNWSRAIFDYNHSLGYVGDVLALAERYRGV